MLPGTWLSLAAHRGQEARTVELLATVERTARERGEGRILGTAGFARALLANSLGRHSAAVAPALDAVRHDDLGITHWALGELVEAAARSGQVDLAREARDRLATQTVPAGTAWALGAQAVAEALAGPRARAEDHYREAVERLGSTWLRLPLARAHLLYGEWLRRENRRGDARVELRTAHEAFVVMGADAFAERAAQELTATGEVVGARSPGARNALTEQEAQIARLAADRRTNPEIGAVLFLSPRTVEWHLRKVYTKLGVTSRRELGAALHDREGPTGPWEKDETQAWTTSSK